MVYNANKDAQGFTLIEILISLLIVCILTLGIYSMIILSIQLTADNKAYVEAIEIANQKIEQIRNMPYDSVGIFGGLPTGDIPQEEIIIKEAIFKVNSYVIYHDDPYDGECGSTTPDSICNDYKIASVKVSWQGKNSIKDVTLFSKIISRTEETYEGYGLLKIYVANNSANPVPSASVRIVNNLLSPPLDVTNITNSQGVLSFPATSSSNYEITVTKAGYGEDRTYAPSSGKTPEHLTCIPGNKREEGFVIDKLATFNIKTVTDSSLPENWLVNESSNDSKSNVVLSAQNGTDNIFYTWQNLTSTTSNIYIQYYDTSGAIPSKGWANDIKISTSTFQTNPDIITMPTGDSFIVWQDNSVDLKKITRNNNHRFAKNKSLIEKNNFPNFNIFQKSNSNPLFYNSTDNIDYYNYLNPSYPLAKLKNLYNNISSDLIFYFKNNYKIKNAFAAGAVTFLGVGAGDATAATWSINIDVPAGVQVGDFLLAFIHNDRYNDGPIDPPAGEGWNVLNNDIHPAGSENNHRGGIFWKFVGAGDPASYTFRLRNDNDQKAGHIRAYRNVDILSPFDGALEISLTDDGNKLRPAPSHTVSVDGSMLVCGWGSDTYTLGNNNPTFPASMSNERNNVDSSITAASSDESVDIADSPTGVRNFDANQNTSRDSFNWSLVLSPAIIPDDIQVSAIGTQVSSTTNSSTDNYLGGTFVIKDLTFGHNITSIMITENGTIDAQNDLENINLYYDIDNTLPYDCVSENYSGGESSFGPIDTNTFNGTGTTTFNDIEFIDPTNTMCVYVVVDVKSSASAGDTIDIKINNPSTDVNAGGGIVIPALSIEIDESTIINTPPDLQQIHYRWIYDDNIENIATPKENEDTITTITKGNSIKLRIQFSNEGSLDSGLIQYRIEYGKKISSCSSIVVWTPIPGSATTEHWEMNDSAFYNDGDNSTDIDYLNKANIIFKPGELKDTNNTTSAINLSSIDFTEIEYAFKPNSNTADSYYCFRLTNSGSTNNFNYIIYPELAVVGDQNIYLIKANNDSSLNNIKKVNDDITNENQSSPRIAITNNSATTTVVWEDKRSGISNIYMQKFNISGDKISSNIQLTSSSTDEISPAIAIDSNDDIIISWVDDGLISKNIYLQKYNLSGTPIWSEPVQIAGSIYNEYSPDLALDNSNNIYLSWEEEISGIKNIILAKYNTNGILSWGSAINPNISNPTKNQFDPSIALSNTHIHISWTDDREGNNDIYTQKYELDGDVDPGWSTEDLRINIHVGSGTSTKSDILFNSFNNSPYSAWEDSRNANFDIYSTTFTDPGAEINQSNALIQVVSANTISETPKIYEYDQEHTSDGSGNLIITVENDPAGYSVYASTTSGFEIVYTSPSFPISISPDETINWKIYVKN